MKSKHKPLPISQQSFQKHEHYHSLKPISTIASSTPQTRNHLPLTNKNSIDTNTNNHNHSIIYQSLVKPSEYHTIRQSPYIDLPSLNHQNNQNLNSSNISEHHYYSQPTNQHSSNSIYEKLRLDSHHEKPLCTQESEETNYHTKNNNQINTKRKHNHKRTHQIQYSYQKSDYHQPKCQHKSSNFNKNRQPTHFDHYQTQNTQNYQDQYNFSNQNISQQLIKRHINQKLDRVCAKIDTLSREKDTKRCEKSQPGTGMKIQWKQQNHTLRHYKKQSSPKLCYSSIVYQQDKNFLNTPKPTSSHHYQNQDTYQDNLIQHRISSPPKPTHQQFLESRIIQMEKKITFANAKILKLQEELLQQKQKSIRKEKEWLMRENQLLNWIEENQVEEQQAQHHQSPKKTINNSNIFVNVTEQNTQGKSMQFYKESCANLHQLINNVIAVFKLNQHWLSLMNRTPSQQLPGTAFRVKEQMNLNFNSLKQTQTQCFIKINQLLSLQKNNLSSSQKLNAQPNSCFPQISVQQNPLFTSNNQSQVFLLQSYCPPLSQQYEISTKRNSSNLKHSSRKSLLCVSESKSTTNKKQNITSTHKKNNTKSISRQKERKHPQFNQRHTSVNRSLYQSRKSQLYRDEVFHDANPCLDQQTNTDMLPQPQKSPNQLFYLLSVQAFAIQNLIQTQKTNQTPKTQQDQNLLDNET